MSSIERLTELFMKLPGIGPRQSKRFVFYLLNTPESYRRDLVSAIQGLKSDVSVCKSCLRFHNAKNGNKEICSVCLDGNRDSALLMVVAKDIDFENVERSGSYKGYYYVLGGTIPVLSKEVPHYIRDKELISSVQERAEKGLKEVILALPANTEGENTASHIRKLLESISGIKISVLGRGLSTGAELEYVDKDTIRSALQNRS